MKRKSAQLSIEHDDLLAALKRYTKIPKQHLLGRAVELLAKRTRGFTHKAGLKIVLWAFERDCF